jgi:hypothetical protein
MEALKFCSGALPALDFNICAARYLNSMDGFDIGPASAQYKFSKILHSG